MGKVCHWFRSPEKFNAKQLPTRYEKGFYIFWMSHDLLSCEDGTVSVSPNVMERNVCLDRICLNFKH